MTETDMLHGAATSMDSSSDEPYVPKRFARKDTSSRQSLFMSEDGFEPSKDTCISNDDYSAGTYGLHSKDELAPALPDFLRESAPQPTRTLDAGFYSQTAHQSDAEVVGVLTDEQLRRQMQNEQRAALSSLQVSQQTAEEVCNPLYKRGAASSQTAAFNRSYSQGEPPFATSDQKTAYLPRYNQQSEFFDSAGPEDYMPDDRPVLRTIKPTPEERPSKVRGCFSTFVTMAVVLALAFLTRSYVLTPYEIPTGSMISTINVGDRVFAERISSYLHPMPARGDIITFPAPTDPKIILIKRCIAIEGDTINITEDGKLMVNDVVQDEPYVGGQPTLAPESVDAAYLTYPYTLGKGQVWVMGDNRTNSMDSRYFGPIDASKITGHAFVCYWPIDHISLLTPVDQIVHLSDPNELK